MSADDLTVDVLLNKDVQKGEVISIDLNLPPNLSLSSSSFLVQEQSTPTPQVEVTRQMETLQAMEEKLEKRCGLMEEETRKLRDACKKMEEERELSIKVMEQAGKERERLKKEVDKVEEIKKELRDKLQQVAEISQRLAMEKKTDDVASLPSPSQNFHSHYSFISPPSPDILQ